MKTRWVALAPASYAGRTVGDGQCVEFVKKAAPGLPDTARWQRGPKVRGAPLEPGTVIATFTDGRYTSANDGSAHAAVLIEAAADGLLVYDQWLTHPVASRVIRFKNGVGLACDDGDRFYCVETEHGG
jgi:hypothetical protein